MGGDTTTVAGSMLMSTVQCRTEEDNTAPSNLAVVTTVTVTMVTVTKATALPRTPDLNQVLSGHVTAS